MMREECEAACGGGGTSGFAAHTLCSNLCVSATLNNLYLCLSLGLAYPPVWDMSIIKHNSQFFFYFWIVFILTLANSQRSSLINKINCFYFF